MATKRLPWGVNLVVAMVLTIGIFSSVVVGKMHEATLRHNMDTDIDDIDKSIAKLKQTRDNVMAVLQKSKKRAKDLEAPRVEMLGEGMRFAGAKSMLKDAQPPNPSSSMYAMGSPYGRGFQDMNSPFTGSFANRYGPAGGPAAVGGGYGSFPAAVDPRGFGASWNFSMPYDIPLAYGGIHPQWPLPPGYPIKYNMPMAGYSPIPPFTGKAFHQMGPFGMYKMPGIDGAMDVMNYTQFGPHPFGPYGVMGSFGQVPIHHAHPYSMMGGLGPMAMPHTGRIPTSFPGGHPMGLGLGMMPGMGVHGMIPGMMHGMGGMGMGMMGMHANMMGMGMMGMHGLGMVPGMMGMHGGMGMGVGMHGFGMNPMMMAMMGGLGMQNAVNKGTSPVAMHYAANIPFMPGYPGHPMQSPFMPGVSFNGMPSYNPAITLHHHLTMGGGRFNAPGIFHGFGGGYPTPDFDRYSSVHNPIPPLVGGGGGEGGGGSEGGAPAPAAGGEALF